MLKADQIKTVAVVGSGIAGLTAAYLLSKRYAVTVFEKNNYIGGHTNTVDVKTADADSTDQCNTSSSFSAGDKKLNVFLGLVFNLFAI